jgi:hypothetical protein
MLKFLHWITGGRPMRRIGHAYTERCTGKPVSYFVDAYGDVWMAKHRWSIGRTPPRKGMVQQ